MGLETLGITAFLGKAREIIGKIIGNIPKYSSRLLETLEPQGFTIPWMHVKLV
jgi:hypothetical protein